MDNTSSHHVDCAISSVVDEGGFYFMCRLCALKFSEPHGMIIFSGEGCAREIAKKIQDCLQFIVAPSDKFPQTLCQYCVYKLEMSHEFLMRTLDAQQYLSGEYRIADSLYPILILYYPILKNPIFFSFISLSNVSYF